MEYLATQGHPGRMAPGVMTAAIADALIVGSGIIEGYAVAMIQMDALTAKKGAHPRPCAARARRAPLTTQGFAVFVLQGCTPATRSSSNSR